MKLPSSIVFLLFLSPSAEAISNIPNQVASTEFTQTVYQFALEFANHIQPSMTPTQQEAVAAALHVNIPQSNNSPQKQSQSFSPTSTTTSTTLTVDSTLLEDDLPSLLFSTIHSSINHSRLLRLSLPPSTPITINLKSKAPHFIKNPIKLSTEDSFLDIVGEFSSSPTVVSGGIPLQNLKWEPYNNNIFVASLSLSTAGNFDGLRLSTKRATRARYPNGNPETDLFPDGYANFTAGETFKKPLDNPTDPADITVNTPDRSNLTYCENIGYPDDAGTQGGGNCHYVTGVGGGCSLLQYSPPSGYWCHSKIPRGLEYVTRVPSGLTWSAADDEVLGKVELASYVENQTAVVNAFREGHWFSYSFLVDHIDQASRYLSWTTGGFQGGEGADDANEWYIENLLELLDAPNEWFYDAPNEKLYYYPNSTNVAPPSEGFVATREISVFEIVGDSPDSPALNITIRNVNIVDTKLTYLEPHGLPSDGGGDWR